MDTLKDFDGFTKIMRYLASNKILINSTIRVSNGVVISANVELLTESYKNVINIYNYNTAAWAQNFFITENNHIILVKNLKIIKYINYAEIIERKSEYSHILNKNTFKKITHEIKKMLFYKYLNKIKI